MSLFLPGTQIGAGYIGLQQEQIRDSLLTVTFSVIYVIQNIIILNEFNHMCPQSR